MSFVTRSVRRPLAVLALVALAAIVALPTLAADPPPSEKPGKSEKAQKTQKAEKTPKAPITVSGTITVATDANGHVVYSVTSSGTTYQLDAGPSWFHGDKHPLKAFVGKAVKIEGTRREGATEIDVATIDGKELRAPGKPPWAGGWKRVGEAHPGWTQEKWDRWQTRIKEKKEKFGVECWPPGHCKKAPSSP